MLKYKYQRKDNMKILKGFTLSELMIAITVLGIICAAVLPSIVNNNPNQNKIMMKKVYYTTTTVVSDMINNPSLYPLVNKAGATDLVGFDNTDKVRFHDEDCEGNSKFIKLFAKHLNIEGTINTSCSSAMKTGSGSNCRTFTTPDGIKWSLVNKSSTTDPKNEIVVDVNGNKKPNCIQGDTSNNCKNRDGNFDRFSMNIYDDGQIEIPTAQTWAKEAISVSSSLTDR